MDESKFEGHVMKNIATIIDYLAAGGDAKVIEDYHVLHGWL